jgi:hypothetical protein
MSPVSERRIAMTSETGYGWYSRICEENADFAPYIYTREGGAGEVKAHGVCTGPELKGIMWPDKQLVGLVQTRTAREQQ